MWKLRVVEYTEVPWNGKPGRGTGANDLKKSQRFK